MFYEAKCKCYNCERCRPKKKYGYTSRPQAIIAALERAEKIYLIEEFKKILKDFKKKEIKINCYTMLH